MVLQGNPGSRFVHLCRKGGLCSDHSIAVSLIVMLVLFRQGAGHAAGVSQFKMTETRTEIRQDSKTGRPTESVEKRELLVSGGDYKIIRRDATSKSPRVVTLRLADQPDVEYERLQGRPHASLSLRSTYRLIFLNFPREFEQFSAGPRYAKHQTAPLEPPTIPVWRGDSSLSEVARVPSTTRWTRLEGTEVVSGETCWVFSARHSEHSGTYRCWVSTRDSVIMQHEASGPTSFGSFTQRVTISGLQRNVKIPRSEFNLPKGTELHIPAAYSIRPPEGLILKPIPGIGIRKG